MKTRKLFSGLSIILCLFAVAVNAQSTSTIIADLPFEIYVPCQDEWAVGTINLHIVEHYNQAGEMTGIEHYQPQKGILIGQVTGKKYHANGVSQAMMNSQNENGATTYTLMDNANFVGQGGVHLRLFTLYHITINANGDVTTEIDNSSVECF